MTISHIPGSHGGHCAWDRAKETGRNVKFHVWRPSKTWKHDSHTRVHRPAHHWRTTEQSICLTHDCYSLDTEAQGLPVEISQYNCQFRNTERTLPSLAGHQSLTCGAARVRMGQLYAHRTLLLSKIVSWDETVGSTILTLHTRKRCSPTPIKTQNRPVGHSIR